MNKREYFVIAFISLFIQNHCGLNSHRRLLRTEGDELGIEPKSYSGKVHKETQGDTRSTLPSANANRVVKEKTCG